jgi:hypothetical protein
VFPSSHYCVSMDEALCWVVEAQRDVKRIMRRVLPPWTWEPPPEPPAPAPSCAVIHAPVDFAHWLPNMPRGSERM